MPFCPLCRNGSKFRESVPLWKALFRSIHSAGLVGGIALLPLCRNGSKFRESVPLWKALFRSTRSAGLVGGIAFIPLCRNGSKFRESVPLWCHTFFCALSTPSEALFGSTLSEGVSNSRLFSTPSEGVIMSDACRRCCLVLRSGRCRLMRPFAVTFSVSL